MFLSSHQILGRFTQGHVSENGGTRVLIGSAQEDLSEILLPKGRLEGNSACITSLVSKESGDSRTVIANSDVTLGGDMAAEYGDRIIEIIYQTKDEVTHYLSVHLNLGENEGSVKKLLYSSHLGNFLGEKIHGTYYFQLRLNSDSGAFPGRKISFSSQEREVEGDIVSTFSKQIREAILKVAGSAYIGCDIIDDLYSTGEEEWFTSRSLFLNIHEAIERVKIGDTLS